MKGEQCKFLKFMEGPDKRFVIPVYQRNYDWKTENCKQLYDDLIKIIKASRKRSAETDNGFSSSSCNA